VKRITELDWSLSWSLSWPLLGLGACLLALSVAGAFWIDHFDDANAGALALLQAVPYAIAAWLVVRGRMDRVDSGRALATILIVGLVMRLLLLPGWPVSTDIYRYVWDGRVQGAGINPYLHLPADEMLAALRDGAIYPYINRADYAPTIYPPASQIVFYLVTRISETALAMKAAMLAFEGLAVWAMLQLLAARGLPRSRILLYAWHPLPLWEFARSGHLDIVAIAFLLLAFLAIERRSPILAGIALGAGVLVKYFPIVTGPALYKRWDWRLPIAFVATIAVLYLPYLGAGTKVLGFLGRYVTEEGIEHGSGIFLWRLLGAIVPLPEGAFAVYFPAAAVVMAALALFVIMRRQQPGADIAGAMLLAVTFTILLSPHYAWYFAWLVPFLCFYPVIGVVWLTCAGSTLYFAHWPPTVSEGLMIYGPCVLLLIAEFAFRRRRKMEERHGNAVPA
jgi:alpha-1,6-mannosyltransferase